VSGDEPGEIERMRRLRFAAGGVAQDRQSHYRYA
jgi:hypothetical protein